MTQSAGASSNGAKRIHATPTKDFFVNMITRDITLRDCIFDLLDNAIDGARRSADIGRENYLTGYWAQIDFDRDCFRVTDNCGGIALSDAIDYAFHFGRRPDSPADVSGGIGLYGIGMKRAIFKIGRVATVLSETERDSFGVLIDVDSWSQTDVDWDFRYEDRPRRGALGTEIEITKINPEIAASLGDSAFRNELVKLIARDYAFFLQKGLSIRVGEAEVPCYKYTLKSAQTLLPAVEVYEDDGVEVRMVAGLIDELPDDVPDEVRPKDVERYGWFVVCNDRIVVAADKTARTIWGDDGYRTWHPQYNGFSGFTFFAASDQRRLPWTTTKRELDASNAVYRRAISRMKQITGSFIEYTNARKSSLVEAKQAESVSGRADVYRAVQPQAAALPKFAQPVRPDAVTISYPRPRREIEEIRKHLGRVAMTAKDVGIFTFEYYLRSELGK